VPSPVRTIPYVNLAAQWESEREDLLPVVERVLASGTYIGGTDVDEFEAKAAELCQVKYCVALNSGTDALVCGLLALGVGRGDEVITPPNSFVASTASIVHIGAKPVFVDVLDDQNIDPEKIESAITPRTKAIMPVHLTGRMAKMDEVMEIAERHGIPVIEDAAQSIGATYKGRMSGSVGKLGCFSTHPLKNLNACGDGGFVVTSDESVANLIRRLRNHGLVDRNSVERFGYVSRMDAIQAAVLNWRIDQLPKVIQRRQHLARLYDSILDRKHVFTASRDANITDTFHTYVIQVDRRDELQSHLAADGVSTAIHYPIPIHLQPAAAKLGFRAGDFPVVESQAKRILSLPINQFLSDEEVIFIAETVNAYFRETS